MDLEGNAALRALAAARTRPAPHPPTPQCERPVAFETQANGYPLPQAVEERRRKMERKGFDPDLCSRSSSYVVGARHYCAHHAGEVALAALVEAGRARMTTDNDA